KEIREALSVAEEKLEKTFFIIPVRLEEVEVPKRLSGWQWANLFETDGYQRLLRALSLRASAIGMTITASAPTAAAKLAATNQQSSACVALTATETIAQQNPHLTQSMKVELQTGTQNMRIDE